MKKLILISGKAESGKDTTANILKEILTKQGNKVVITHYAKYLKQIATDYYGWNGEKDDKGRKLLQQLGNEIIRERMGMFDFNVIRICEDIQIGESVVDYVIIPDTRYENEIYIPINVFGKENVITVKVVRPNHKSNLNEENQKHKSENALNDYEFDITLTAENIEELEKEVEKVIERLVICGKY